MKKVLVGLFLVVAIMSTGCLGEATTQILGTWRYEPTINPSAHNMYWTFQDNGQMYFFNATTSQYDTGSYEMYVDGTHRMIKIKGTTIQDHTLKMNGEWFIVDINLDVMRVGTKDQGGFQQRDLIR
jgi:hypothetical protein